MRGNQLPAALKRKLKITQNYIKQLMGQGLKYTIKKDSEKGIYLVNEQGAEVAATDILDKCGDRRVFAFNGKMGAGKTTFIKCLQVFLLFFIKFSP